MNKAKTIYIATIIAYCGGTLALTILCQTLRSIGYDARLILLPYFPNKNISQKRFVIDYIFYLTKYFTKQFVKRIASYLFPNARFVKYYHTDAQILKIEGIKIRLNPFLLKSKSIVIYPEDVYGNPLDVDYVVRWLLYYYDYLGDRKAYDSNDLFIAYREIFNVASLNPNQHVVTISHFNNRLYRQYNFSQRSGRCYIVYKGCNRHDIPTQFDGPVFDSKMSQEELVEMLNTYEYCYCYDPQTFYMKIAAVCGCIPVLIMEKGKTERDYLSCNENHYGIAYGDTPEQIKYAIDTRKKLLEELDFTLQNKQNTMYLINILEDKYGQLKKL